MSSRSTLPAHLIERLEQRIESHAGLSVPTWVLESRLKQRATALALENACEYIELVCGSGLRELDHLIEALRVGETRFFRHRSHIRALTDVVVPALVAKRTSTSGPATRVRIWSAGCATGEEAYTLAMVMAKHLPRPKFAVDIQATDISGEALAVARMATYGEDALRHVPKEWRSFGFCPAAPGQWRIAPPVADLVRFEQRNLADTHYPRALDVILCRNVLIYFTPEARQQVITRMLDCLTEGGFLFVGYAETLREFAELEMVRTPDALLYRKSKPAPAAPARPKPIAKAKISWAESSPAIEIPGVTAEEAIIELRGRYDDDQRLTSELSAGISGPFRRVIVALDGADYLGDEAAAVLRRAAAAARAEGVEFSIVAERPGTRRWLRRCGFDEDSTG